MMRTWLAYVVLAVLAISRTSSGQAVSGVVRDSMGVPIAGATISIPALRQSAETDARGEFRLANVTPGMRMLSVRRIGYAPFSRLVSVAEGDNALSPIVLGRLAVVLDTVVTEEQLMWREDPLLREMADNMKIGLGHFVLRPELEKLTALHLSTVFEQRNGFVVLHDGSGHSWIASSRGPKSFSNDCPRLENASGPAVPAVMGCCFPKVYLDNQPLSIRSNEVPEINQYLPENLEAIEMYVSAAQTPARYNTLNSQCGVVILHSRKYSRKRPE
jgi:hypothetical protein